MSFDDRGLLRDATGPSGGSSFTYTPDGRMASRTDAAGVIDYGYDGAGRLSTVDTPSVGVDVTVGYNDLSQPATIFYGTGVNRRSLTYRPDHRLEVDELKTAGGATIGKITYGWDSNGNITSKTTAGFAGSAANGYGYDRADRLTSWDDGSAVTVYDYDGSGNRLQAGAKLFTYDQRNQLKTMTTTGVNVVYSYTPRGTLSATSTLGGDTVATRADGFGQVTTQFYNGTQSQTYDYDGLGRAIRAGHAYTGVGNHLAADGSASYVRAPAGQVLAAAAGGVNRLVWADAHTDVVAQFTPTGTGLAGSVTYEPYGRVAASAGMIGSLGYQSEWTDTVVDPKQSGRGGHWHESSGRYSSAAGFRHRRGRWL